MLEHLAYPYMALVVLTVGLFFWRPVWGIALFIAIFPMDPWAPRLPVPGVNTETIMIGIAFAVTVLRFGAHLPPLPYSGPVLAFIAAILIGFVIAVPWASGMRAVDGNPAVWFIFKYVKSMTFTALLFFITYWWVRAPEDRQRIFVAICIAIFLSSVAGIVDFQFDINPTKSEDRANGFVDNANAMAETIGPMMFVPLYLLIRGRDLGWTMRLFVAATYALAWVTMVLSLSRGNWVATIAAHAVFLLLLNRRLLVGALATAAVLAAVGAPVLPGIVRDRIEATTTTGQAVFQVPGAVGLEGSTALRIVFARIGLDMFKDSPIWGHGLNAFAFQSTKYGAKYGLLRNLDPHSLVLRLAAELGTIGLAVLGWLVWAVYRCGRRLWRSDSRDYMIGAVLLAAATHDLVANLSSTTFLQASQVSAQFWILYAIAARACVERFAEQEAPAALGPAAPRWRRFAPDPALARAPAATETRG